MPSFIYTLNVPRATLADSPCEIRVPLPAGILQRVEFIFPPGPCGEVGIRALLNDTQIVPSETNQWVRWDAGVISLPVEMSIVPGENLLILQGISPDANFDHGIMVKVDVLPTEAVGETVEMDVTGRLRRVEREMFE